MSKKNKDKSISELISHKHTLAVEYNTTDISNKNKRHQLLSEMKNVDKLIERKIKKER